MKQIIEYIIKQKNTIEAKHFRDICIKTDGSHIAQTCIHYSKYLNTVDLACQCLEISFPLDCIFSSVKCLYGSLSPNYPLITLVRYCISFILNKLYPHIWFDENLYGYFIIVYYAVIVCLTMKSPVFYVKRGFSVGFLYQY